MGAFKVSTSNPMKAMMRNLKRARIKVLCLLLAGGLLAIAILPRLYTEFFDVCEGDGGELFLYVRGEGDRYQSPLEMPEEISMIRLIAVPSEFDGERIRVRGVVYMDVQEHKLFLSEYDFKNHNLKNALHLMFQGEDLSQEQIRKMERRMGCFVVVDGVFRNDTGGFGLHSGVIEEIRVITR